jgi:hypothetical protein
MLWCNGLVCVLMWIVQTVRRAGSGIAVTRPKRAALSRWHPLCGRPPVLVAVARVCRRPSGVAPPAPHRVCHVRSRLPFRPD